MQVDIPINGIASSSELAVDRPADDPPTIDEADKSSYTERDILHHHYFGRRGIPVTTRATKFSWQELPFVKPVKVEWKFPLSEHGLLRLIYGYEPMEMPDKWFVYADGPDQSGTIVINFIRSWMGKRTAELLVRSIQTDGIESSLWTGEVIELTFEGDEDGANRIAEEKLRNKDKPLSDPDPHKVVTGSSDLDTKESSLRDKGDPIGQSPTTAQPNETSSEERGEIWIKFLVATVFEWVLHIDIDIKINEPERWTRLASEQAELVPITQTTYMGTSMPQETIDILRRLGPGTQITFT